MPFISSYFKDNIPFYFIYKVLSWYLNFSGEIRLQFPEEKSVEQFRAFEIMTKT